MQPELETRGTRTDKGWRDHDGFIGPVQPGTGPRSDPRGDFPAGPEVGDAMPDVRCVTADVGVYALSYDEADALRDFRDAHGITYTLPVSEPPAVALRSRRGATIEPNAMAHFQRMSERRRGSD